MLARKLNRELLNAAEAGNLHARTRVLRIVRVLVLRTVADVADKRGVDADHLAKVAHAILEIPSRAEQASIWFERGAVCQRARRQRQPGVERLINLAVNRGCRWLLREGWMERLIRWLRSARRAV